MTASPDLLRHGDHGIDVRRLQLVLASAGWLTDITGEYDDATEAAVRTAQHHFGLVVDGVAGPKTQSALLAGTRDVRHLSDADLQAAAATLDVSVAAVRAVNEVESRGCGFLPDGRPIILFERHIMYRELKAAGRDADALARQYPNLVNPQRGGYAGGAAEHTRLVRACAIDRACALASASWGAFQIMGFHWQALGYASVEAFVDAMKRDEAAQLDAFVRFIQADPALLKALRARKWATFASLYNGPAYKANLYDVKLQRAFEKYEAREVAA